MELTFEQGDERALAFIDTEDIIKHLEDLGYSITDLSEGGSLKSLDQKSDEVKFRLGWKHLCSLYKSEYSHCLKYGCGRKTLQHWANKHYSKYIRFESAGFYRSVLFEAVRRGWAVETITIGGYRSYKLHT